MKYSITTTRVAVCAILTVFLLGLFGCEKKKRRRSRSSGNNSEETTTLTSTDPNASKPAPEEIEEALSIATAPELTDYRTPPGTSGITIAVQCNTAGTLSILDNSGAVLTETRATSPITKCILPQHVDGAVKLRFEPADGSPGTQRFIMLPMGENLVIRRLIAPTEGKGWTVENVAEKAVNKSDENVAQIKPKVEPKPTPEPYPPQKPAADIHDETAKIKNSLPGVSWRFTGSDDDMGSPTYSLYFVRGEHSVLILEKQNMKFRPLSITNYNRHNVPKDALSACHGWWAGQGVTVYIKRAGKDFLVYQRLIAEGDTDRNFVLVKRIGIEPDKPPTPTPPRKTPTIALDDWVVSQPWFQKLALQMPKGVTLTANVSPATDPGWSNIHIRERRAPDSGFDPNVSPLVGTFRISPDRNTLKWLNPLTGDWAGLADFVKSREPSPADPPAPQPNRKLAANELTADIDQDGRREIIRWTLIPPSGDSSYFQLHVMDDNEKTIWSGPNKKVTDHPFVFFKSDFGISMPELLHDIDQDGQVELLAPEPQSDVSPTSFRRITWKNGTFTDIGSRSLMLDSQYSLNFQWKKETPSHGIWVSQLGPVTAQGLVTAKITYLSEDSQSDSGTALLRFNSREARIEKWIKRIKKTPVQPQPTIKPNRSPWIFPDSDRRLLQDGELRRLSKQQLWKARNEIYARRGYIFTTPRGRAYASSLGRAYSPKIQGQAAAARAMNATERSNIKQIQRYE